MYSHTHRHKDIREGGKEERRRRGEREKERGQKKMA